ncbi:MAG: GTP 3',8-cyclase MoaA [Ruminococcaceae bacterium]|jgi:cyclic pyranopterin phosphate synthase|nr:GTP 3',8-cyclase MoaA [Oscillospiraceae bacterium]
MRDLTGRTVDYLRLSVTDLCNYRCIYCMGEEGVCKLPHREICSIEELTEMSRAAVACGVRKIRLTGGEPLVRWGILDLCRMLRDLPGLEELAMTTNGTLLPQMAGELKAAGVDRLNISLDTLDEARFRTITRRGELREALAGLAAAEAVGFTGTKVNAVLLGGVNDADIAPLAELARDRDLSVRFIELMPIGECADWPEERFRTADAVLQAVPALERIGQDGVAELYRAPGWRGTVGLIRPISCCFCAACDRIRITADGRLKPCLHSRQEISLRGLHGMELEETIRQGVAVKPLRHHLAAGGSDSPRAMHEIGG